MVKFPYDEQECTIHLGALGVSDGIIDIEPSLGFDMQHLAQPNMFDIISTKTKKADTKVGITTQGAPFTNMDLL